MSLSFFLSLDSLIVSMAMVMLGLPRERRVKLCVAFMLFDGVATFLGLSIHSVAARAWVTRLSPAIVCAYVLLVLLIAKRAHLLANTGTPLYLLVPIVLSLDNLLAGIAGGPSHSGGVSLSSLEAALTSGLFAVGGTAIAPYVAPRLPQRWAYEIALVFLALPVLMS